MVVDETQESLLSCDGRAHADGVQLAQRSLNHSSDKWLEFHNVTGYHSMLVSALLAITTCILKPPTYNLASLQRQVPLEFKRRVPGPRTMYNTVLMTNV